MKRKGKKEIHELGAEGIVESFKLVPEKVGTLSDLLIVGARRRIRLGLVLRLSLGGGEGQGEAIAIIIHFRCDCDCESECEK